MRRFIAATVFVATIGGTAVAASAIGQGTGGSLGAGAVGSLSFDVRFTDAKARGGMNPAVPRSKKRPKVMDIHGGNGDILVNGQRVGRAHGFDVITFEGAKEYKGGAEAMSQVMLDFGNDDLLFGSCRSSQDTRNNPCAITGGTGRFAGARGTAVQNYAGADENKGTLTLPVTVTFIP